MRRALLDTNIYSLAMRGDAGVVGPPAASRRDRLYRHQLRVGFRRGSQESKNRAELGRFLDAPRVRLLSVDEATADFYAAIVVALRRAGTPIPTNDIWIAALAQRHGLPVYSKDAHCGKVPGLVLVP